MVDLKFTGHSLVVFLYHKTPKKNKKHNKKKNYKKIKIKIFKKKIEKLKKEN